MKMIDVMALIKGAVAAAAPKGYRVHFELRDQGVLRSDFFPERDEPLIALEDDAWEFARRFAETDPGGVLFVNIYVIHADHSPVFGYSARKFNPHPQRVLAGTDK